MAFNNFRPDYEYLESLGFVEKNSGENHPFDRFNELSINPEKGISLGMNAFWDFSLITSNFTVEKYFSNETELEKYIQILKDWKGDGMSYISTLRMYEQENYNFIIDR